MNHFEAFKARGFVKQLTDDEIAQKVNGDPMVFYVGFDPTAASMHVGHFMTLMSMRMMQRFGHKPIVLLGGGTAVVGDPSGKSELRKMLTREEIDQNANALEKQFRRFFTVGDGPTDAVILNNLDWLGPLNYLDFLRDIGTHFSVNRMLTYESVKLRLEKGLTFLEFNYNLLQSYDFYHLAKNYGCVMQMGGDDQWGNIVSGIELVRRKLSKQAFGLTNPLITTASGTKMGKTEKGAVWLDPEMTTPYDFYQYWVNVDDRDVGRFMRLFTDMEEEVIAELEVLQDAALNEAKARLAWEVTNLVHGKEEADNARNAAKAAFSKDREITPDADIPTVELPAADLEASPQLVAVMGDTGICGSRGEAKRLVKGGGVSVNNKKISSFDHALSPGDVDEYGQIIIRVGKKRFHRLKIV